MIVNVYGFEEHHRFTFLNAMHLGVFSGRPLLSILIPVTVAITIAVFVIAHTEVIENDIHVLHRLLLIFQRLFNPANHIEAGITRI